MTIIKVKNQEVLDLSVLQRRVLRFIYDKDSMTSLEIQQMEESIVKWSKKWNLNNWESYQLERMAWALRENEKGRFEDRKRLFKLHDISYQKFHRLPGAVTEKDKAKAEENLKEWEKKNEG